MKALRLVHFCLALTLGAGCHRNKPAPPPPDKNRPDAAPKPVLRFMAYDDDPTNPEGITFQLLSGTRSCFLRLDDTIPNTPFKLTKFDAEGLTLTVTNTKTNEITILPLRKPINVK